MKKTKLLKRPLLCALLLAISTMPTLAAMPDPSVSEEIKSFLAEQPAPEISATSQSNPIKSTPVNNQEQDVDINRELQQTIQQPVAKIEAVPVVETQATSQGNGTDEDGPPSRPDINVNDLADAIVKSEERSRYGNPPSYFALGKRYNILESGKGYHDRGIASWYGTKFHNKPTSSREPYDMYKMTAAHKTLPIPCYVRVTNLQNGKHTVVRVNDRGPFHDNRIIDLSYVAAKKLGILGHGTGLVDVELIESVEPTPLKIDHQPQIFLQVGAFSQHLNAQTHANQIGKRFHRQVELTEASLNNRPIWRVQLGPIRTVEESDAITRAMKLAGLGDALAVVR